jgi:hypothetical protein
MFHIHNTIFKEIESCNKTKQFHLPDDDHLNLNLLKVNLEKLASKSISITPAVTAAATKY